MNQCDLL